MPKIISLAFIYGASWCYVIASYYHLHLKNWSFAKAMLIAMPLVVLEYTLSLHGNKIANHALNPIQILILTIAFYVINLWLLNFFVIKASVNPVREIIAMVFIVAAILISSNLKLT